MQTGARETEHTPEYRYAITVGIILLALGVLTLSAFPIPAAMVFAAPCLALGLASLATAWHCERNERRTFFYFEPLSNPKRWAGAFTGLLLLGGSLWVLGQWEWGFFTGFCALAFLSLVCRDQWNRKRSLHAAASAGEFFVVRRLLDRDAGRVNERGRYGRTALQLAAARGWRDVAALLLERSADVNAVADGGWTALHWAAMRGHAAVVALLVDAGVEIDARADDKTTALYWAAREGFTDCVAFLLTAGADASICDTHGRTPLQVASMSRHTDIVQLLRQHGAVE